MKWGICEDGKEELVGLMDEFALDKKVNALTIGYLAAGKALGKGMRRALGCALSFLFTVAGVNRVQAEVLPENKASKKCC